MGTRNPEDENFKDFELTSSQCSSFLFGYGQTEVLGRVVYGDVQIYFISSDVKQSRFALKIFDYINDKPSPFFENEIRFSNLLHNNIISIECYDNCVELTDSHKNNHKFSYILMEYAPYRDLYESIQKLGDFFDEKLTRTYFKQLISGIEYLHGKAIAHLDLKPENLLISRDFQIKIADFDLSYIEGDDRVFGSGTADYRAPEMYKGECEDPFAADIYSAGCILFFMKTQGALPKYESDAQKEVILAQLLEDKNECFWQCHALALREEPEFFSKEFKELFHAMTRAKPSERITIQGIKESEWFNGPTYETQQIEKYYQEAIKKNNSKVY